MIYRIKTTIFAISLSVLLNAIPIMAGGPAYITGSNASQPGRAYRWSNPNIRYKTDLGYLGNQDTSQSNAMVTSAFQSWQDVDSSNVSFQNEGNLDHDITSSNVLTFQNALGKCSDSNQPANSIIYDVDGSIMDMLGMDKNSVLGFAGSICTNDATGTYTRGWAVLNGRFIDGQAESPGHNSASLGEFQTVLVHEFGHLIGLGHSQINLNCASETKCSAEDLSGVPTMFPLFLDPSQLTLKTDDRAAVSALYPASSLDANMGRIQGRVMFADGVTPAQGYNVIARQIGNPRRIAVSSVSGYLFTAGTGNALIPEGSSVGFFYGSHDSNLIGYYDIPGLPPGDYTVEVEAINNSGATPFVGDRGVGPIGEYLGFQYKMPGKCSPQYLNYPSTPGDSCSSHSVLSVGPGHVLTTNTNIVLIGTPSRLDAWEGP